MIKYFTVAVRFEDYIKPDMVNKYNNNKQISASLGRGFIFSVGIGFALVRYRLFFFRSIIGGLLDSCWSGYPEKWERRRFPLV